MPKSDARPHYDIGKAGEKPTRQTPTLNTGVKAETVGGDLATVSGAPPVDAGRPLEHAIGRQVRALRRLRDLSVVDLASAADISMGMLSKIENGQISASLSTILSLSRALNVPITSLFTAFEDDRDCFHVPKGEGERIERRGTKEGHLYDLLGSAIRGDVGMEPYLITLDKTAVPYTGFRHAGCEFIYMLTGEIVYRHAERDYHLRPGDSLLFDSGALHGPERLLSLPSTYLSIIVYARDTNQQ